MNVDLTEKAIPQLPTTALSCYKLLIFNLFTLLVEKHTIEKHTETDDVSDNQVIDVESVHQDHVPSSGLRMKNRKVVDTGRLIGFKLCTVLLEQHEQRMKTDATIKLIVSDVDKMRFLCKDIWQSLFSRNIDTLQTNHKGTYILHDRVFQWFMNVNAVDKEKEKKLKEVGFTFIENMISGALKRLEMDCTVTSEVKTRRRGSKQKQEKAGEPENKVLDQVTGIMHVIYSIKLADDEPSVVTLPSS